MTRSPHPQSSRLNRSTPDSTRVWRRYPRQKVLTLTANTLNKSRRATTTHSRLSPWFRPSTLCSRLTLGLSGSVRITPHSSCTRRFIKLCLPPLCQRTMIIRSKAVIWRLSKLFKKPKNFYFPLSRPLERRKPKKRWPSNKTNTARA